MTSERDFIGLIESYLDEFDGATPLPDATRDAIRAQLPSAHQRPAWWPRRRIPSMNNAVKFVVGAAAAVVVALLGINLFVAPNIGGPGLDDPSPTPTAEATPTAVARLANQAPLDPGRYVAARAATFDVTVEVPAGWSASDGWVTIGPGGNEVPDGMAIRYYTVNTFAANPLSTAGAPVDPLLGPTVDDLVEAIVAHPDWVVEAPPTSISIDGYAGQLVDFSIPMDAALDAPNERYFLSRDAAGGGIWGWAPGQRFNWYIIDVDGHRFVIDAFHYPETSEEDLAAQRAVVESVEFDPDP